MRGLNEWYEEKTDGRRVQAPTRNVSWAPRPQSGQSSVGHLHGLGTFGLTTLEWADQKTPALIQSALQQSSNLKLFIANKVGAIPVSRNYHHYGSDAEFVTAYLKLNKIVVPFGPQEKALTDNVSAFYHRQTDSIHLRPRTHFGAVLQMAILKYSSPGFAGFFGEYLANGVGLYFTNLVLKEKGLDPMKSPNLKDNLDCAKDLVGVAGLSLVGKAYFQNHSDLINYLTTKLSIGPVRVDELTKNSLCTTLLLRTAQLANHDVKNMVGVGMTGPGWVRLWMRSEVPGMHELQIIKGKGSKSSKIIIPPDNRSDNTIAITYPPTSEPKLEPRTKYRFRVVRTSDAKLVGEGSFETSPPSDGDTPQKVVIGLVSCHQPFTDRGTISPQAERMLSVLPRILKENDVKFVLPCGDQMYADEPGSLSLFNPKNPYLIRQAFPNRKVLPENIFKCTDQEVRRLYDLRYRMFWSMPAIREMYANYPCYPTMDDHEIKNGWGSDPKHSSDEFKNIKKGALDAYLDYQASSVLPPRLWECESPALSITTSVTATLGFLSWTSAPSGTTLPLAAARCSVRRNSTTYDFSFRKMGTRKCCSSCPVFRSCLCLACWPVSLAWCTSRRVTSLIIGLIPITFRLVTNS